jgi:hypothetical protein
MGAGRRNHTHWPPAKNTPEPFAVQLQKPELTQADADRGISRPASAVLNYKLVAAGTPGPHLPLESWVRAEPR